MAKYRQFTIDTNFFISGYGENPQAFHQLARIFEKLRIKISIPDYVQREMRWYMRRSIEPHLKIIKVDSKKLRQFEDSTRNQVDIGLPQTPDMAVAYIAKENNLSIVSSDLRLVEVSQAIGIEALMNSAFLVMILEEVEGNDKTYLQKLYQALVEDEIRHSVKSQNKYDPVIRIQKIMDSAMSVLKKQASFKETEIFETSNYDFPEYIQLVQETKRIRTDISSYIETIESGNLKEVRFELQQGMNLLFDLLVEMQIAEVHHDDPALREASTTLGHILLLASAVALMDQRLTDASSLINQLSLLSTQNEQLKERLDIDIHLQRFTIFFLTEQYDRFKIYFTPNFAELCEKRDRQDILILFRTMPIIIAALTNKSPHKEAIAKDFSEIQYIIQLGVQFINMKRIENAWILLEQALYMSINSEMHGLIVAVLEVLLPLSFIYGTDENHNFLNLVSLVKKSMNSLPEKEYQRRAQRNEEVDDKLIRKRAVVLKNLPSKFTAFFDVISSETVDFKQLGRCTFVRVVDWQSMNFLGFIDPTCSLDDNLSVGDSIQLQQGYAKVIVAGDKMKERRGIDLLVICKKDKLRFIARRAGQVHVIQSRVGEYDL